MTDSKTSTATERLREMLDGRGEEWEGDEMPCAHHRTVWGEPNGFLHEAIEFGGLLNITSEALDQTPEQAIAATLGNAERTCENVDTDDDCYFMCSRCRYSVLVEYKSGGYGVPNYCPNCGAKVVSE